MKIDIGMFKKDRGRLTRPRIDLFMFHFLIMQTGRELPISQIFQEFRDWRDLSATSLEALLTELRLYSSIFKSLITPKGNDRVSSFAHRLRSLDTSTVYPFLMHLIALPSSVLNQADRDRILEDVEIWLIRRMICRLTNKNYNKFFVSLLAKVKAAQKATTSASAPADTSHAIFMAVRDELLRSSDDTVRWPPDDEFESGWMDKPVYVKSRPDRSVMLLKAIDAAMMNSRNEAISLPDGLTVEHLLPQQGTLLDYPYPPDLPLAGSETTKLRRDRLIHTLGNLTLLTSGLNSSISNGPFINKRPQIAQNSALRLNSLFQDATSTQ